MEKDRSPRIMIEGSMLTVKQFVELMKSDEGKDMVAENIQTVRACLVANTITSNLGLSLSIRERREVVENIIEGCWGIDTEEIVALMFQESETAYAALKALNLTNYDC